MRQTEIPCEVSKMLFELSDTDAAILWEWPDGPKHAVTEMIWEIARGHPVVKEGMCRELTNDYDGDAYVYEDGHETL